jgi:hypothetical protein
MSAIREAVDTYIASRRWDTLVGRAFDMLHEDSREEFAEFLTLHMDGVLAVISPRVDYDV